MARWTVWGLAAMGFAAGFYLRMNAAYGPLNLSLRPADWLVLWELLRYGQISARVLLESLALGLVLAALVWAAARLLWRPGP